MDPEPNIFSNQPARGQPPAPVIASNGDRRPRFHKKTTIFIVLLVLILGGVGGGYVWYQNQQQFLHHQKVLQAQAAADRKAALERQGTVEEIEALFQSDNAQETNQDAHLVFTAGDSLQREATSAVNAGENNATSL